MYEYITGCDDVELDSFLYLDNAKEYLEKYSNTGYFDFKQDALGAVWTVMQDGNEYWIHEVLV